MAGGNWNRAGRRSGGARAVRIVVPAVTCCERQVPSSNTAQDGELWTCPTCKRTWIHICEEAEGCCWEPYATPAAKARR